MEGDLTTLAAVEQFLSLDPANPLANGNADEPLLSSLISACSAFFVTYCGRTFTQGTYTEISDGKRSQVLFVKNPPIVSVASVIVGTQSIPPGGPETPGYLFGGERIVLRGYRFWAGFLNVSVTYTGGYAQIPYDLAEACIEQVALRYKERKHFDMSSQAKAGETTAFVMADMKPSTKSVLDRYRRRYQA